MIKKLFLILFFLNIATNSYSAGSDSTTSKVKSDYDKAVESIKFANECASVVVQLKGVNTVGKI